MLGYRPKLQAELDKRVRENQAKMDRHQHRPQPAGAVTEPLMPAHQQPSS